MQFSSELRFLIPKSMMSHLYTASSGTSAGVCILAFTEGSNYKTAVFGAAFLGTYYTIFDQANSRIGFALYKDNPVGEASHFLEIYAIIVPVIALVILLATTVFSVVKHV